MFPKKTRWQSKKYRDAAMGEDCKLRLPGCRNERETVVLAHCPGWLNKRIGGLPIGMGAKADDWNAVDACAYCHNELDQRSMKPANMLAEIERIGLVDEFEKGRLETIVNRIERGVLK